MSPDRSLGKAFRKIVEICTAGPGIVALLVLLSWIIGKPMLGTWGSGNIPMAPGTAGLMLLLSCAFFLRMGRPDNSVVIKFAFFSAVCIGVVSLLALGQFFFHFDLMVEQWQAFSASPSEMAGDMVMGRISPMTALFFLATALAFGFQLPSWAGNRPYRQTASLLVLIVFIISLLILLSYGVGAPLFISGQAVPLSFLTAVSFIFLSLGLLATAGSGYLAAFLALRRVPKPPAFFHYSFF